MLAACERQNRVIFTPFLTESEGRIAERICGKTYAWKSWGGYADAQRKCYAFLPDPSADAFFPIWVLHASYQPKFQRLTHRDVLGAFMHQGIEREQLGDIIVAQADIYVMVKEAIAPYLQQQVTRVRRASLCFTRFEKEVPHTVNSELRTYNVSSLRLDAIVGALCHLSRGKAAALIEGGAVKVNDMPLEQCSALCNNNSAISIRGYGRFQFIGVQGTTRKKRCVIEVKVYC